MEREPEHPAAPEQVDHGFDEGVGRRPRSREERRIGRFSHGIERDADDPKDRRRFSEGVEERPGDPEHEKERRFSEGVERDGDD